VSGYILGKAVEFDLDEIWEYIAADNIDAADRLAPRSLGKQHAHAGGNWAQASRKSR
jgi:hypothetical protein